MAPWQRAFLANSIKFCLEYVTKTGLAAHAGCPRFAVLKKYPIARSYAAPPPTEGRLALEGGPRRNKLEAPLGGA
eukprot:4300503-Prymnesium_polylepis.1